MTKETIKSEVITLNQEINIEKIIYEVHNQQVILDFDLAKLYECKNGTKSINQAVKKIKIDSLIVLCFN